MTSTDLRKAISPLRARMIEDMTIRKFTAKTQRDYIAAVKKLADFLRRPPDTATPEDIRGFQLHLTRSGVGVPTINSTVAALRFFFKVTLGRDGMDRCTQFVHCPRKLPVVLSPEEVFRLLDSAPGPGLKYKAAMSVAYGAGLRASEVACLKVIDIDSERMMIRVEQGSTNEFIRRFLIHVLPQGFHRIRHYGLLANGSRVQNIAKIRKLFADTEQNARSNEEQRTGDDGQNERDRQKCPYCGGRMVVIETFEPGSEPRCTLQPEGIDSS